MLITVYRRFTHFLKSLTERICILMYLTERLTVIDLHRWLKEFYSCFFFTVILLFVPYTGEGGVLELTAFTPLQVKLAPDSRAGRRQLGATSIQKWRSPPPPFIYNIIFVRFRGNCHIALSIDITARLSFCLPYTRVCEPAVTFPRK